MIDDAMILLCLRVHLRLRVRVCVCVCRLKRWGFPWTCMASEFCLSMEFGQVKMKPHPPL